MYNNEEVKEETDLFFKNEKKFALNFEKSDKEIDLDYANITEELQEVHGDETKINNELQGMLSDDFDDVVHELNESENKQVNEEKINELNNEQDLNIINDKEKINF